MDLRLYPFIETSGGLGSSATLLSSVLVGRCVDNNLQDRAAEKYQLCQRIKVAEHRSNTNMVLSRVAVREPVNLRFCREKLPFTTSKRLRDDISEAGPLAKTPLCFVLQNWVERELRTG